MSSTWPGAPAGGGSDVHLDEALSAYLDGELDPTMRQHADAHLSTCAECRYQLDALSRVKTILQSAAPVDPPAGFIERVVKERRRRRFAPAIGVALGMAALWLLVVGIVAADPLTVSPPVGDVAAAHAGFGPGRTATRADTGGDLEADDLTFEPADDDQVPAEYQPPEEAAGAEYVRSFRETHERGWLVVYEAARRPVVVYEQMGQYQVGGLPGGGEQFEIEGSRAWRSTEVDGRNAVVVQRGEMVYTLVGEVATDDLIEIAAELPEREGSDPAVGERLNEAVDRFLDGFSLGV